LIDGGGPILFYPRLTLVKFSLIFFNFHDEERVRFLYFFSYNESRTECLLLKKNSFLNQLFKNKARNDFTVILTHQEGCFYFFGTEAPVGVFPGKEKVVTKTVF
jgi:hypothetical protein